MSKVLVAENTRKGNENIFEEYLIEIERLKLLEIKSRFQNGNVLNYLELLEKLISILDDKLISLYKTHSVKKKSDKRLAYFGVVDLLKNWFVLFNFSSESNLKTMSIVVSLTIKELKFITISDINSQKLFSNGLTRLKLNKAERLLCKQDSDIIVYSNTQHIKTMHNTVLTPEQILFLEYIFSIVKEAFYNGEDPDYIEKINLNDIYDRKFLLQELIKIKYLYLSDHSTTIEKILNLDHDALIETHELETRSILADLYLYNDIKFDSVWDLNIKISNNDNLYDFNKVSYLLWLISSAVNNICGDEASVIYSTSNGSKNFQAGIKINDLIKRDNLITFFTYLRQHIDSYRLKKSFEEIKKTEKEAKLIEKEIQKKEIEIDTLEATHAIKEQLALYEKYLELEERRLGVEKKKAEIANEKIETLKNLAELIGKEIVNNNFDFNMIINDILYIETNKAVETIDDSNDAIEKIVNNEILSEKSKAD
jgi:hypothetical protein